MNAFEIILALAWIPWCVLAFKWRRRAHKLQKQLDDQPIGRIVKAELTEEGLMMTGQIFSSEVWDKMAGDLEGMSIGYGAPTLTPLSVEPVVKKKRGYW